MNAASERRLTRPLAAIALVLGVLLLGLFAGLGSAVHWAPPRPVAPLPAASAGAALPPPVPLQQFAAVWQHPLFSPDRKPTVHAAGSSSDLGAMQLTGIILTRGLRMALLHDKKSGQEVRVHEGDKLPDGSWTLTQLRARSALFDSSNGRAELKLPAGAPIDTVHGEPKATPAGAQFPADEERQGAAGAGNTWISNGQGGAVKAGRPAVPPPDTGPDQPSPDQPPTDQPQQQPAPEQSAPPAEQPAPAASQGVDREQAARIQRLRETILKRRAAQAAAAAHEGDR
jgi:general secretion pathway protein N